MPTVDPVILQLKADVADYNAKIGQAQKLTDQRLGAIERRGFEMGQNLSKGFNLAKGAALTFAAGLGAIGLVELGQKAVETALRFKRFGQGLAVATGSAGAATREIGFLRDMADRLGLRFITLAENFTGLAAAARGTALEGQKTRDVFEAVTKAIVATGGSSEQVNGALLAVQQMMSKGSVSAEELRGQLGERLPGAFQIAARAMGVTTAELGKMLEQGQVASTDFLPRFADQLGKELPASLQTADAAFQRFQTALDDIANSTADGFMKQLGDATDDLTATLKNLQNSGAMEAIGSFLGEVIRLGSSAAQVVGDLVLKWRRFNLEKGVRQQDLAIDGWFTPEAEKEKARGLKARFQAELERMDNPNRMPIGQTSREALDAFMAGGRQGGSASTGGGSTTKLTRTRRTRSGRSQADIEARQASELARLQQEELRATLDLATNAGERADISRQMVDAERAEIITRMKASKTLTAEAQEVIDRLYGKPAKVTKDGEIIAHGRPGLIKEGINRDLELRQARLANDQLASQAETAEALADIQTSTQARNELEREALRLHQIIERNLLNQAIDTGEVADAERAQADLATRQAAQREALARQQLSPGQRYRFDLATSIENVNEAVEGIAVQGLERLNDGLTDAIMGVKSLGDVFQQVSAEIIASLVRIAVQKSIIGPLADALFGGGGGLSQVDFGAISRDAASIKLDIPAFARGTNSAPRGLALVGERGPELVRFNGGEQVIPNHKLGAGGFGGGPTIVQQHFHLDARGAVMTHDLLNQMNGMAARAAQVATVAGSADAQGKMMARARRRIPG